MKKENKKELNFIELFTWVACTIVMIIFVLALWMSSAEAESKKDIQEDTITLSEKIEIDSFRLDKRISTGYVASYEYWLDYIKDGELYNVELSQLKIIEDESIDRNKTYFSVEDCGGADCHPLAGKDTKHVVLYVREYSMSLYEKYDFRNILVEE